MATVKKIAIPAFDTRVSPRFDCAKVIVVLTIDEEGEASDRDCLRVSDWVPRERVNRLLELGVDTVICGGIDRWSAASLQAGGVTVYGWVTGEVEGALAALLQGELDSEPATEGHRRCACRRFPADDRKKAGRRPWPKVWEAEGDVRGDRATLVGLRQAIRNQFTPNHFISRGESSMASKDTTSSRMQIIAIPLAGGRLCAHFGHCEQFALLDVDPEDSEVLNTRRVTPPPHQPGLLPRWLRDQGVNLVIAGGMGGRAQGIFAEQGIEVLVGAPAESPDRLARSYLDGTLQSGENTCDH